MAWTQHVSQSTWRNFQRGGKWIPPHLWAACQAKAKEQRHRSAGAAWRNSGGPSTLKWSNGGQPRRPAPQPAPKPTPKARVKPETPEGTAEVTELKAQLRQQQQLWAAQINQINELLTSKGIGMTLPIPAPPAATSASPAEELKEDYLWTRRQKEAHDNIRKWEQKVSDARERQRSAKRAFESAANHLAHHKEKLQAAKERSEIWETLAFVEIDCERDSQADDQETEEGMSTTGESSMDYWDKDTPPAQAIPQSVPPAPTTPFQHQLSPAFPNAMASPFAATGSTTAQGDDALMAQMARHNTIMTEGANNGIPNSLLEAASKDGITWEQTWVNFQIANMAAKLFCLEGTRQDLTAFPLAQRMAEHLTQLHNQATVTPIPVTEKDVTTLGQEIAAGAMS